MIWLYAEDDFYYSKSEIIKLKQKYRLNEIIKMPTFNDIKEIIENNDTKKGILAPYRPTKLSKIFENSNFFEVIRLPNYYEPFTKNQIALNIDKKEILAENLGINIVIPTTTFKDYIGAERLIVEAKKLELKMISNLKPKGLFLVGLPGTGKSFFVKCFAGETNRILIELNFSKILEDEKPIEKLTTIINYLQNNPAKYLVWIDEIEKMFSNENSQQILGAFLTMLNEFNTSKSNALFIATANNISDLSNKNPELFRTGGRFDKIIALKPPTEENAFKIFNFYFKNLYKLYFNDNFLSAVMSKLFNISHHYYKNTNINKFAELFIKEMKSKAPIFRDIEKNFIFYKNAVEKRGNVLNIKDDKFIKKCKLIDNEEEAFIILKNKFIEMFFYYYDEVIIIKEIYDNHINATFFEDLDNFIKNIIYYVNTKYRAKTAISDRFPYTQAEIQTFVSEIYSNYFYTDFNLEIALDYTITNIIPLQVQMKEQIKKMAQNINNYLQI